MIYYSLFPLRDKTLGCMYIHDLNCVKKYCYYLFMFNQLIFPKLLQVRLSANCWSRTWHQVVSTATLC